ncbi:hypothetical protein BDZ45DRAFT_719519 [Acephala macrosclerotiorum]|nr:hypothetical protein BDZ45DRAFT_719519 [Acephala macrosclerotiorum]
MRRLDAFFIWFACLVLLHVKMIATISMISCHMLAVVLRPLEEIRCRRGQRTMREHSSLEPYKHIVSDLTLICSGAKLEVVSKVETANKEKTSRTLICNSTNKIQRPSHDFETNFWDHIHSVIALRAIEREPNGERQFLKIPDANIILRTFANLQGYCAQRLPVMPAWKIRKSYSEDLKVFWSTQLSVLARGRIVYSKRNKASRSRTLQNRDGR